MLEKKIPLQRMVFVCTNRREDDSRPACGARGGEAICEALKEEVKKRGLKGKIRALKSGCMDLCELGPNVMIYPEGVMETDVKPTDIPRIVEKWLNEPKVG